MSVSSKTKTSVKQVDREKKEVLTTEYLDLYYISSFDTGNEVNVIDISEKILSILVKYTNVAAYILAPLHMIKYLEKRGWSRIGGIGVWVKPFIKSSGQLPQDIMNIIRQRIFSDISLFSGEYLSKTDYVRLYLGDIIIKFGEQQESSLKKLGNVRGYIELFIHRNGVFVLTITIPIHDLPLSSREVIKIRYLLESNKVLIEIPSIIYITWLRLKIGKEGKELHRKTIGIKTSINEIMEMYTIFIKRIVAEHYLRRIALDLLELEKTLRNPWDIQYTVLFTEILKGKKRTAEMLIDISPQLYTMMYGTRRLVSKKTLSRSLKKSFYFIPSEDIGRPSTIKQRRAITRVTVIATDTSAHIVSISRKYLGPTEIGTRLRLKHITVFELLHHVKQSLRVIEHLTLRRPRDLDELVDLKEKFSCILDLTENNYFIIDKDMRELYEHVSRILEINRFILRVERRLDALNYMIMTRYQDKINKMQMTLTMMFGIFGVPFFIFSYVQWYFDYVVTGKSVNFWPITIATFVPTLLILMLTMFFYYKWKTEVFGYKITRYMSLRSLLSKLFRKLLM